MSGAKVIIICGVSGCGKSTIGTALAEAQGWRYVEGDDHHPESNVEKMSSGVPLTDQDRTAWLDSICTDLELNANQTTVLACSALTPYVQSFLNDRLTDRIMWVKLEVSPETAKSRMEARDHFMPASLLQSQFEAWHPPATGLSISAELSVDEIVDEITNFLIVMDS